MALLRLNSLSLIVACLSWGCGRALQPNSGSMPPSASTRALSHTQLFHHHHHHSTRLFRRNRNFGITASGSFTAPSRRSTMGYGLSDACLGRRWATLSESSVDAVQNNDDISRRSDGRPSQDMIDAYAEAIEDILENKRVRSGHDMATMQPIIEYLKNVDADVPPPPALTQTDVFIQSMKDQTERFIDMFGYTQPQYEFGKRSLVYLGDLCAKRRNPLPLVVAWRKMMEMGLIPHEKAISTYMYVAGLEPQMHDTLMEIASLHDVCFQPSEKTTTLRIKTCLSRGEVEQAEQILSALPDKGKTGEWKRLRTFMPLIDYYCETNDASSLLRNFRAMRNSTGVVFDADAYGTVLSMLARNGNFHPGSPPIDCALDHGFSADSGPVLFDDIMAEMATDILELPEAVALRIARAFEEVSDESFQSDGSIHALNGTTSTESKTVMGQVLINTSTALCPATGTRLRLFELDELQQQHVHDTLLEMATIQHQEFLKRSNKKIGKEDDEKHGFKQLSNFSQWLDTREGEPFTAIVDGANIAYFGHAQVHYNQIKLAVDELEKMGERPLVIMPAKYTLPKFMLARHRVLQMLTEADLKILDELTSSGKMYKVPARCLDDYYWMLGSVSNQTVARAHVDLSVSIEDDDGRFPGLRPMLVTNDQMRDHKLDLLDPREFRRWCSCHIVNYRIPKDGKFNDEDLTISFIPADFFSKEIQGNPHSTKDNLVWHIPVTEWEGAERLCIWIPPQKSEVEQMTSDQP